MRTYPMSEESTEIERPLSPQRWILVGHDQSWRDEATARLEDVTHPMAKWRQEAKLIVVATPAEFEKSLQAAVDLGAPEVATFTQEGTPYLGPTFRRVFPVEHPFTLPRLYKPCTFEAIERVLTEPESHVIWRWLMSGRKRMPALALDSADLRAEANRAHLDWAESYRQNWTEGELDEMFGNGDPTALERGETLDDQHGAERPEAEQGAGDNVVPILRRKSGRLERPGWDSSLAAQSRSSSARQHLVKSGQVKRSDGTASVFWTIELPKEVPDEGSEGVFEITLRLDDREWQRGGYAPPILSISAPGMLPVLARPGSWDAWGRVDGVDRVARCSLVAGRAFLQAIKGEPLVRMLYSRSPDTGL